MLHETSSINDAAFCYHLTTHAAHLHLGRCTCPDLLLLDVRLDMRGRTSWDAANCIIGGVSHCKQTTSAVSKCFLVTSQQLSGNFAVKYLYACLFE